MIYFCSICTEILSDIKLSSITPCGHVFHLECLNRWLIESETCPECRQSVSASCLVKLYPNEGTSNENSHFVVDRKMMIKIVTLCERSRLWNAKIEKIRSFVKADIEETFKLELLLRNDILQKYQFIKSLESKIANLEETNRQLNFENEFLNGVKTIVNGAQLEAEEVLSRYSSNAGEENAAKKLASYCSILKCELDRVIDEKKALEFNFQEMKCEYSNKNSELTQFQKLVEKFKKDISLLEAEKRDLSGYDYSKDSPSSEDEQEISMRDNITENVNYSPITVKFAGNQKKIGVRIVDDEIPTTSKLSMFNKKKVVLSSSSTLACQDDLITRIGYDGFGGPFEENLPKHLMGKKRKSTFSRCELQSPLSKR